MPPIAANHAKATPRRSRSRGLVFDRVLDLSDPADRAEQADQRLIQMAADAGLLGMEQLVSEMHDMMADISAAVC